VQYKITILCSEFFSLLEILIKSSHKGFLPKLKTLDPKDQESNKEPLYVGFFHTGAYQDQISGYGGIKHCLIPSPKHVIVERDRNGKLIEWVYAKEQTAQSMLKILGYLR
jgi:arginine decarboxylase